MRNRLRHLRTPVAAVAVAALVGVSAAPASADGTDDPAGGLLDTVTKQVQKTTEKLSQAAPTPEPSAPSPKAPSQAAPSKNTSSNTSSKSAPAPSSDDDSAGHETKNPSEPDHAQGRAADVSAGDQDVASVGNDKATVKDDDSTKADSTLLALGGQEILGAHASSNGKNEDHAGDPLKPLCDGTEGSVCLRLLYSDANASDDGSTSHSSSESGVAAACIGGDSTDPQDDCDGPVALGAAHSSGRADRDQNTGRTTGSSSSGVADLCASAASTGSCDLGADAVSSQGSADSGNSPGSADRSSSVLGLTLNGQETEAGDATSDPMDLSILPGCDDPSLLCAFLNQGETYLGDGVAGHAQEALQVKLLGGTGDVLADTARTETLVHNDGGNGGGGGNGGNGGNGNGGNGGDNGNGGNPGDNGNGGGPGSGGPGGAGATPLNSASPNDAGALPNTGGTTAALVALGLIAVAAGAFVTAYGRKLDGASLRR